MRFDINHFPKVDFQTSEHDIFRYIFALEDESERVDSTDVVSEMPYDEDKLLEDLSRLERMGYLEIHQKDQFSYLELEERGKMDSIMDQTSYDLPKDECVYLLEQSGSISLTEKGRDYVEEELNFTPLKTHLRNALR